MKTKKLFGLICIVVLIMLVMILFVTNIKYNKYYDYNIAEKKIGDLKIGARLLGQYKQHDKTVLYTGPYELMVWFRIDKTRFSPKLSEVSFINRETDLVVVSISPDDAIIEHGDGVVYFVFKDVEIDYSDYGLLLEYKLEHNNEVNKITLSINKEYEEFISFRFWDRLMGV